MERRSFLATSASASASACGSATCGAAGVLGGFALFGTCACASTSGSGPVSRGAGSAKRWEQRLGPVPERKVAPAELFSEVRVSKSLIAKGRVGRRYHRPMKPRYITIHSTQNYTGDAWAHAKALHRGALRGGRTGYLCWHFTVQDNVAIQHLPTNEQGEHADFDGPGNRYSIGIEMCEHRGNDLNRTVDRTSKLAASLMYHHGIALKNVVPHYHWPRKGYRTPNKNCPHFLLESGRPGRTWQWFLSRVDRQYKRIATAA